MPSVGIIGLGIMGSAYARNLLAAGIDVHGADPRTEAQDRLTAMGGVAYEAADEWCAACDLVILSLVSPEAVHDVVARLARVLHPGQVVLETGTFSLEDKRKACATLSAAEVHLLDCPVSGTGVQAETGDIVMMASGDAASIARAKPLIEQFTKKIIDAGPFGAGTRLKFVANHAVALHNVAAAETLAYADALGIDRQVAYDMLSSGAGQSKMSDLRMPLMMESRYDPPTASLKMFEKDLSVIGDDLRRLGLDVPLFEVVDRLYSEARERLPETFDTAAVFEVYRRPEED